MTVAERASKRSPDIPTYGGRRFDFEPPIHTLALFEDWPLRWVVEDENGAVLSSFAGLTWGWVLLDRLDTANGWTAALAAALISKEGVALTASVPNVDISVTAAEQAAATGGTLTVRPYAYELWELAAPQRRVAYGYIRPQH